MPTYTYRCPTCQINYDQIRPMAQRLDVPPCPDCGGSTRLIISAVNFARSTVQSEPHLSTVTGQVVRNTRDLEEQIKKLNGEQGTHYALADPTDPSVFGVTDEGLDEQTRGETATGQREVTKWM